MRRSDDLAPAAARRAGLADPPDESLARWTAVLLVLAVAATAALAWSTRYIPAQDGPSHINIAAIFRDLLAQAGGLNSTFYQVRPHFFTNYGVEAVAIPLLPALGPFGVEKLLFTAVAVGIPAGIITAMHAVTGRLSPFMLVAVPYGYTATLASGNYNFLLGMVLGLFVFAAVLRRAGVPSVRRITVLALCWVVMVLVHPAATVVTLICCFVLILARAAATLADDRRLAMMTVLRYAVTPVPAMLVLGGFLLGSPPGDMEYQRSVTLRLRELILQYDLLKLSKAELAVCLLLSLTLAGSALLALWRRRPFRPRPADALLVVAAVCTVLYFVAPNRMSGGDSFVSRIELLPWIMLMIWLSAQALPRLVLVGVLVVGTLANAAVLTGAYVAHAAVSADIGRYMTMTDAIPPGAIVMPVIGEFGAFTAEGAPVRTRAAVFQHMHNALAIEKRAVFLDNWNAHFRVANVMFRADHDPYADQRLDAHAAWIDQYEARTGVRVGYLLLWRVADDDPRLPSVRRLIAQHYTLVQPGPGPGLSGVYRRRDGGA